MKPKSYYIDKKKQNHTNHDAVLAIIGFSLDDSQVLVYSMSEKTVELVNISELTAVTMDNSLQEIFDQMKSASTAEADFESKLQGLIN